MDYTEQIEILSRWGVRPRLIEPMQGGAVNQHWRVETDSRGALVLRRYNPRHAATTDIAYEHAVLWHLEEIGWPVAPPIPTRDGLDVAVTDSGHWSLFNFLPGAPAPSDDPLFLQRKGAVLALIQRDLTSWKAPGQRSGFGRVVELDVYLRPDGYESFPRLLDWLAERDEPRAAALSGLRQRNLLSLHARNYDDLPDWTVYGECLGNNVLFNGKDVTGLLDFDFVHRDARVCDAARSLVVDCGRDPQLVARWLGGYATFAEPALSQLEADIIPDLMMANAIWNVAIPLSIASRRDDADMLAAVLHGIDVDLPKLEASLFALRKVTHVAAGFADRG